MPDNTKFEYSPSYNYCTMNSMMTGELVAQYDSNTGEMIYKTLVAGSRHRNVPG
jgi:hypothetical protein